MKKAKAVYEYLPIYGRHIFYGSDVSEIKKLIKKKYKPSIVDADILFDGVNCHGFVSMLPCEDDDTRVRAYVMFVDDEADIGTVAHEATHLTNRIFMYLGLDLDSENDEAQAYLTGHFVQQFMTKIRGMKHKEVALKNIKRKR